MIRAPNHLIITCICFQFLRPQMRLFLENHLISENFLYIQCAPGLGWNTQASSCLDVSALAFFSFVTTVREKSDGQPPTKQGKNCSPFICRPFSSKPNYSQNANNIWPSPCLLLNLQNKLKVPMLIKCKVLIASNCVEFLPN